MNKTSIKNILALFTKKKLKLPVIQSLWIGHQLSAMEQLSIRSFLQNGHPYHLYIYDEVKGIPEGVEIKDANSIIDRNKIFKYKNHDSYAGFSNLFRYALLLEKGNYWADTDIVCLKPFIHHEEHLFAGERRREHTKALTVNCCLIKAPKGSKLMQYCYDSAAHRDPNQLEWGQTGPKLLTEAVTKFDMWEYVAVAEEFCPVNWWDWQQFIDDSSVESCHKSWSAVHLWNEMWRRENIDKNGIFPESSLYEKLKKIYL